MPSLSGLIGGVIGGAAGAYGEVALSELKNKQRIDIEKALSEVMFERDQRIKEADLMRSRGEEERKLSPEYIQRVGAADLEKGKVSLKNREQLAPETGRVGAIEATAAIPAKDIEAQGETSRKMTQTKTMAGDKGFVKGVETLDIAQKAGDIVAAREKAKIRLEGGGGGGGVGKVRSTYTDDQGNKVAVMSDGSTKVLGRAADFDKSVAGIVTKLSKEDPKYDGTAFSKLPISRQREIATQILTGQGSSTGGGGTGGGNKRDLSGLSKFERQ
jgi:hypothetical protein